MDLSSKNNIINCFDGDFAFLSNFFECPVAYEGLCFGSSEAAFQAAKCRDRFERASFHYLRPGKAKRLGRKVKLRSDWEEVKINEMRKIVREKFTQNPKLQELLINTGNATLIEGNYWHDNFWGNCTCEKCKNIPGQNNLGKILEEIREEISNS